MKSTPTIFLVLTFLLCVSYSLLDLSSSVLYQVQDPYHLSSNTEPDKKGLDTRTSFGKNKTILIWTRFFGAYRGWFDFYGFPVKDCSMGCTFTTDRSKLKVADAVMMHATDLYKHEEDVPATRTANQVWILHNTECPTKTQLDLAPFDNVFNWTSLVRSDSDVPVYYGTTVSGNERDNTKLIEMSSYRNKSLDIAWAVSNCYSSNGREEYVRRLQEFIPVDVYGRCGTDKHLKCPRGSETKCFSKYKFYLAFENSDCKGYITEKLWRTYTFGSIPVVGGGGNYTKVAPPDSFINTADFATPKELAAYLRRVASDEKLYNSYMKWHYTHKVKLQNGQYWCDLCQTLRKRTGQRQVYRHLADWFKRDTCHRSWMEYSVHNFLRPLLNGLANMGPYT